jgi:hypothetical protein
MPPDGLSAETSTSSAAATSSTLVGSSPSDYQGAAVSDMFSKLVGLAIKADNSEAAPETSNIITALVVSCCPRPPCFPTGLGASAMFARCANLPC